MIHTYKQKQIARKVKADLYIFGTRFDPRVTHCGSAKVDPPVTRHPRPSTWYCTWVTFFPAKVHSAFHPSGVGKIMDWSEAAATCAYICFRPTGGKLIIVKCLWACYMKKELYKCTTLLFTYFTSWNFSIPNSKNLNFHYRILLLPSFDFMVIYLT